MMLFAAFFSLSLGRPETGKERGICGGALARRAAFRVGPSSLNLTKGMMPRFEMLWKRETLENLPRDDDISVAVGGAAQ
jgi:hypothetical protein